MHGGEDRFPRSGTGGTTGTAGTGAEGSHTVRPVDVQQWRFLGRGGILRPGEPVRLVNDTAGAGVGLDDRSLPCWGAPAPLIVTRAGTSHDPIRSGERIGLHLAGYGFLTVPDGPGTDVVGDTAVPPAPPGAADRWNREGEWEVTGCFTGVAVAFDRPVGLLHLLRGDHLVARCRASPAPGEGREHREHCPGRGERCGGREQHCRGRGEGRADRGERCRCPAGPAQEGPGPIWAWWAEQSGPPATAFPRALRAVEGVPSDVCLRGTAVGTVRPGAGGQGNGVELLVDPGTAALLGRLPAAPGAGDAAACTDRLPCRWTGSWGPALAGAVLSAGPVRVWVQGPLLSGPGLRVDPVRSLAWALDCDGRPVRSRCGDPSWPPTRLTWRVARLPVPAGPALPQRGGTWLLPLPGRDGEPGTSTTVTPVPATRGGNAAGSGPRRGGQRRTGPRTGGRAGVLEMPPSIVRDVRTGRRMLRVVLVGGPPPDGPSPGPSGSRTRAVPEPEGAVVVGFTVRVHGG